MNRSARCLGVVLLAFGFIYIGTFVGMITWLAKKLFIDPLKSSHLTRGDKEKKKGG